MNPQVAGADVRQLDSRTGTSRGSSRAPADRGPSRPARTTRSRPDHPVGDASTSSRGCSLSKCHRSGKLTARTIASRPRSMTTCSRASVLDRDRSAAAPGRGRSAPRLGGEQKTGPAADAAVFDARAVTDQLLSDHPSGSKRWFTTMISGRPAAKYRIGRRVVAVERARTDPQMRRKVTAVAADAADGRARSSRIHCRGANVPARRPEAPGPRRRGRPGRAKRPAAACQRDAFDPSVDQQSCRRRSPPAPRAGAAATARAARTPAPPRRYSVKVAEHGEPRRCAQPVESRKQR